MTPKPARPKSARKQPDAAAGETAIHCTVCGLQTIDLAFIAAMLMRDPVCCDVALAVAA